MRFQKEKRGRRGQKALFKEIAEKFPNLGGDLDISVHEANRSPYYLSAKRSCLRYIINKPSKTKIKTRSPKQPKTKIMLTYKGIPFSLSANFSA